MLGPDLAAAWTEARLHGGTRAAPPARGFELQRLQPITLTGLDGTVEQTTPPSPLATQILAAVKVTAPPRIAAIQPA